MAKIQIDLFNELSDYMKNHGLNRTQLAKKLGVSKGYISQVLNGDANHKLSTLIDLSLAMDKAPILNFTDIDQLIEEERIGAKKITWTLENFSKQKEPFHIYTTQTDPSDKKFKLEKRVNFDQPQLVHNGY